MVELNSTIDTVVMLLVAGGVGLIGGIGAALIEWRRDCALPADGTAGTKTCNPRMSAFSCVILGGIAAVAILYFFPPTQELIEPSPGGGEPVKTTSYDLTKLVALALIVGSAGAAFLQALQARAMAATNANRVEATKTTAQNAAEDFAERAGNATKAHVNAASAQLQAELQRGALKPQKAAKAVEKLADTAAEAVTADLKGQVDNFQQLVEAVATGEKTEKTEETEETDEAETPEPGQAA